jgi:hypothetical protein
VKGGKISNTIWSLTDNSGRKISSFDGLAHLAKSHLQNPLRANNQANITDVVRLAQFFPSFVNEEENRSLMVEVTDSELQEVLHNFQKNKCHGLDGWTVEFFLGFSDLIRKDILQVVEESTKRALCMPPLTPPSLP